MVTISLCRVEYIPYYIVSDLANITTEVASFFQSFKLNSPWNKE